MHIDVLQDECIDPLLYFAPRAAERPGESRPDANFSVFLTA